MSSYNFTERVRHTLASAREHAAALGREYVAPEHILLALLTSEGVGAAALQNMNVDLARAGELVTSMAQQGRCEPTRGPDLPFTPQSKKAFELAIGEARTMHHSYVGTEHLLLGLLGEGEGIAGQALHQLGVRLEDARHQVLALIGGPGAPRVAHPDDVAQGGVREVIAPPSGELPTIST